MSAATIVRPPPNRNAGQWADAERVLPNSAPEPGKWRTDRAPFWWPIYEAFSAPNIEDISVVCGAQMGKTEAIFNVIGHRMDDGPYCPALYIGPTEKNVKSMSKDRVSTMLETSESLSGKLEKGQRNGVFEKWIAGVRLGFAWAGSATELASHPAGLVMIDEVDRMGRDTGGEGDPISLAEARTKNYANRKRGKFSTPTIEGGSAIWDLLESSAMFFWAWHCKHCKAAFVPQLSLLIWPEGSNIEKAADAAQVVCPHCGGVHDTKDKNKLNAGGRYLRMRRLGDREAVPEGRQVVLDYYVEADENEPAKAVGFWISGLASPWASFYDIASQVLKAEKSGDPNKIQAIVNTYGGEVYRLKGDAPDWEEVAACKREYPPKVMPDQQCQLITIGADVQKNGIYYVVRGWGADNTSWLIDHDYLAGDTEYDNVWLALNSILQREYSGKAVFRAFIDSGYRPGDVHVRPDHAVYTFCRNLGIGKAFPTKGRQTMETPISNRDIDYSYGGKLVKRGVKLFNINTDYFKRWVHARIKWPSDAESGGWFLHNETSEEYCRQVVAEELVITEQGRAIWVAREKDNHYFDCEVLAAAAAYSLNSHTLRKVVGKVERKVQQGQAKMARRPVQNSSYQRKSLF